MTPQGKKGLAGPGASGRRSPPAGGRAVFGAFFLTALLEGFASSLSAPTRPGQGPRWGPRLYGGRRGRAGVGGWRWRGVKSWRDAVKIARGKPGAVLYVAPGRGSAMPLAGALFGGVPGTQIPHVPYKGGPATATAVMSGEATTA